MIIRESQSPKNSTVSPKESTVSPKESTSIPTPAIKESSTEEPHTSGEILAKLRRLMRDINIIGFPIDAYIVPSRDEYNVC